MRDSWRLAVGTLTALPVRPPERVDRRTAGPAMLGAPLAVLPLGALATGLGVAGARLGTPPLVTAVLVVGALAAATRALHLDGLADTADGLAASYDRERSLAVMRSGTVGPAGLAAVVIVLGLQAAALAALLTSARGAVLAGLAVCASRAALALCCARRVPAARSSGLGAACAGSVPRAAAGLAWLVVAAVLGAVGAWAGLPWWRGPLAAAIAALAVLGLVRRAVRRLGGVTGDVFGGAVEAALAALLVALS